MPQFSIRCVTSVGSYACCTSPTHRTGDVISLVEFWGIAFHSWCKAATICWRILTWWRLRTLSTKMSNTCSIGDTSGLLEGQGKFLMFWLLIKSVDMRAVWERALSCGKWGWNVWQGVEHLAFKISLTYRWAFKFPSITTKSGVMVPIYCNPNHYTSSAAPVIFGDAAINVTFITTSSHTAASIGKVKTKSTFITKKNSPPLRHVPSLVCWGP